MLTAARLIQNKVGYIEGLATYGSTRVRDRFGLPEDLARKTGLCLLNTNFFNRNSHI